MQCHDRVARRAVPPRMHERVRCPPQSASASLKPVVLECGGKDPMVVFDDADLAQAPATLTVAGLTMVVLTMAVLTMAGLTMAGLTMAGLTMAGLTMAVLTMAGLTMSGLTMAVLTMATRTAAVPPT